MANNEPDQSSLAPELTQPALTDVSTKDSERAASAAESDPVFDEDVCCRACRYELRNLPTTGTCPECGMKYDASTVFPVLACPSALEVLVRFGWPALLVMALGGMTMMSPQFGINLILFGSILLIGSPINSILQAALLTHRIPGDRRPHFIGARLRMLGALAAICFYVTAVVPPLVFGGCVVLVMSSLS